MPEMLWEDPPPTTAKKLAQERNEAVLRELQAHPGKWARVATSTYIGVANTWERAGCEVTRRTVGPSKYNVWARWPEEKTDA
jgi:hypothetical protein